MSVSEPDAVRTLDAGCLRKARLSDMAKVKVLIDRGVGTDALLPRTLIELCENVRDFHVYEEDGVILVLRAACGHAEPGGGAVTGGA